MRFFQKTLFSNSWLFAETDEIWTRSECGSRVHRHWQCAMLPLIC